MRTFARALSVNLNVGMLPNQGLEFGDRGSVSLVGFAIAVPISVEKPEGGMATGQENSVLGHVRVGAGDRLALGHAGEVEPLGLIAPAD